MSNTKKNFVSALHISCMFYLGSLCSNPTKYDNLTFNFTGKSVRNKFTRSFYHANSKESKENRGDVSNMSTSASDDIATPHMSIINVGGSSPTSPPLSTPETPSSPPKRKLCRSKNRTCILF